MQSTSLHVSSHYFPPTQPSAPALVYQITRLIDSYMIWAGVTERPPEEVHAVVSNGRLSQDWACAMPGSDPVMPPTGTSLFRAANAEVALPIAQRLARRFKKQIFLSVDVPPAFSAMGEWPMLTLEMEKRAVEVLVSLEAPSAS